MIRNLAIGVGVAAAAAAGVGWTIARRLTAPVSPRRFNLTVRGIGREDDGDLIVLDRTSQTTADGIYNLGSSTAVGHSSQQKSTILGQPVSRER